MSSVAIPKRRRSHGAQAEVERGGLRYVQHGKIPPGDGGLAFGQLVHAACELRHLLGLSKS